MNVDIPLDDDQLQMVALIGVVVLAMAAAPILLAPSDDDQAEPDSGTVVTPEGDTLEEVDDTTRDPLDGLNTIPTSRQDAESPAVHASTGAQTMRVETTSVNGEPALNLSDERTHEGRWVSVPTDWFKRTHGEVPKVARIAHESNGTYTEAIQVRGDSAAFYVRGFSTNTVTFGGELVIRDRPAIDGTRHSYQLSPTDSVDNVTVNLTGVENTQPASTSATLSDGESLEIDAGGTVAPQNATVTLEGTETRSSSVASGTGDETITVDGNQPAENLSVTLEGSTSTSNGDQSFNSLSGGQSVALSNPGNLNPTGPAAGDPRVTISSEGAVQRNFDSASQTVTPGSNGFAMRIDNPPSTISQIDLSGIDISGYSSYNAIIRIEDGWSKSPREGTIVKSETDISDADIIDVTNYDTGNSDTVTINVEYEGAAGSGDVSIPIDGSSTSDPSVSVRYAFDDIPTYSGYADIGVIGPTQDVSVTTDTGGSASFGTIARGTSESRALPLTSDTAQITVKGEITGDLSLDKTDRTATEDPSIDLDGDGSAEVSHAGLLTDGETATNSAPDGSLSSGSNTITTSTTVGPQPSWTIEETSVRATEDPSVTVGGSTVSYSGVLDDGETVSESVDLSTGSQTADVSTGGDVIVSASWTEATETRDPAVEVNGQSVSYTGTLSDDDTVSLDANSSWLQDGTNNVTVQVGDGSVTSGPEPRVAVEYRHDVESPQAVNVESEAFSERYNISKTYTTPREDATLTIPHTRTVVSMRSLEYRLNETGSYSSVPQSAANLSGTTLTVDVSAVAGNPVPEGTTVEVRSVGSRVDVRNAEISVIRATPVGFDLDSRVRLDSWSSDSSIGLGETPQSGLVHYAQNESYAAESDYVELSADGSQRLYAPNASSGSELTLNTLPARVEPSDNSMRVRVPEGANTTNTEFVVEPASVVGDSWSAEYVAGTDGQWYAVVDSNGEQLAAAEKPNALEVDRDDVGLVSIEPTDPQGGPSESVGSGVFATFTSGNLPSLLALFGGVGLLFVAGTRPRSSRSAIDGAAGAVAGLFNRIPRVGGPVGSAVETGLSGAGGAAVSVGENRLLTGAIAAAVAVAAAQAGLFTLGSEAGAIIAVAGIAVGSLFLLRRSGTLTTARWIAIVGVSGVVAIQGLGETDLITELVNSDAFLIVVLIAGYAAIQLVREYRANNSPDDDRPQIIIGGNVDDEEGSS